MTRFKANLLREEIWNEIKNLAPVKSMEAHNAIEAQALLLEVLCPEPGFLHNQKYSEEVNKFNLASDAFIQLAAMFGMEDKIGKIFRVHENTAQVTFMLGEYELTRYTFDLSGGGDLSGIDLSRADLVNVYISDLNLSEVNLSFSDLTDANLSHTILTRADLAFAKLRRTTFINADLTGANLIDADLTEAIYDAEELIKTDHNRAVSGQKAPRKSYLY